MFNKIKKMVNTFRSDHYEMIDNLFDYNMIIRPRPIKEDCFLSNGLYGVSYCLKRYSGYKSKIMCAIEHGMPHTFENEFEYRKNDASTLIVCSEERKQRLSEVCDKKIICYGPHIAYASPIYDCNAMKDTKDNLGKTLLLYPMHSIEDYHFKNHTQEFIDAVEKIKNEYNFDTVLVSVYFLDIQRGLHIPFLQKGWQVVSAGNRVNYDFMDIQRTLIELSDLVICQGYSSALGYAGYLKKPIIYQDMVLDVRHNDTNETHDMWVDYKSELMKLFSEYSENLQGEQYSFLERLYGYDCVKTPDELMTIFMTAEK